MGTKVCKPVVAFEDAVAVLRRHELAAIDAAFAAAAGHAHGPVRSAELHDGVIPKDMFSTHIGSRFGDVGDAVLTRLFEVLDSEGQGAAQGKRGGGLGYRDFVSAACVFMRGTREQRLRLVFNMFDLSATGYVTKKDFRAMSLAIIVGSEKGRWGASPERPAPTHAGGAARPGGVGADSSATSASAVDGGSRATPSGGGGGGGGGGGSDGARAGAARAGADGPGDGAGSGGAHAGAGAAAEVTIDTFKPMAVMMVEMAFIEYDTDADGKLSFAEWRRYAEEDDAVQRFLDAMPAVIPAPALPAE